MAYYCEIEILKTEGDMPALDPYHVKVGDKRSVKMSDDNPVEVGDEIVYEMRAVTATRVWKGLVHGRVTELYSEWGKGIAFD